MQYVPGSTLERVGRELSQRDRGAWCGRAILDILDAANTDTVPLDPEALREREFLGGSPFDESVCWLGSRLAQALAHAHAHGVRHRDVKPANVLLNRYGRPLLADFNVSDTSNTDRADDPTESSLGGTLAYMAPEHLDAFAGVGTAEAVDHRADIYALGVVLFELLAGGPAFPLPRRAVSLELLRELAEQRRAGPPDFPPEARVPSSLAVAVRRCLEPDPAERYQTATDLARALDGCRDLRHVERHCRLLAL